MGRGGGKEGKEGRGGEGVEEGEERINGRVKKSEREGCGRSGFNSTQVNL